MAYMPKDDKTAIIRKTTSKENLPQNIRAVLVVLEGKEAGVRYELARDYMEIGRGSDVDIRIPRQDISRKHCLIFFKNNRFFVRDLESTNGTFLNGAKVDEKALNHGDKLQLGESTFLFLIEEKTGSKRIWEI